MQTDPSSGFRFDKRRTEAVIRLSNGETIAGCFFVSDGHARHTGPERIGDLLNAEPGFFPFEVKHGEGVRTGLYNRTHVVTVTVSSEEPQQTPGYSVARQHQVSMLLSTGHRLAGVVRVYRPIGSDRLSDWTRSSDTFHYLETEAFTFIVNAAHIVEITEHSEERAS